MDSRISSASESVLRNAIRAAQPGGSTHEYFRREGSWEAFDRQRFAVAIEWYREGRISQGQGALVAKMSRTEFLDELFRAKVPACQVTVDELMEEVDRAVEANRQRIA